ncbi:hypothetical protein MTR67_022159 [Solanum verrucosum]|uniref:Uncharacterized protein n=1 Tax=Solanum verrucosum TaxID=315347 RepID=A0AAF0QZH1_SOLVR|nr:hypothetical protein MTR67_022159 [Solanum verrucosum]
MMIQTVRLRKFKGTTSEMYLIQVMLAHSMKLERMIIEQCKSTNATNGLWQEIEEAFPKELKESDKADLKERALSAIFMSITDSIIGEITEEKSTTAWKKLEDL